MATFVPISEVIDKTADLVNDANRNYLLKKYILEALQENKIPKSQAMLLLYELSL